MSPKLPVWLLVAGLVPLAAASSPLGLPEQLPVANPLQQNDAGTGADAPNVMGEAVAVLPGAYDGLLVLSPADAFVDLTDREDWYKFWAQAGSEIFVQLELPRTSTEPLVDWALHYALMELRTPGGVAAGWNVVPQGGGFTMQENFTTVASETGWWLVHVLAAVEKPMTEYGFDVRVSRPDNRFIASASNGYVLMAFDVRSGGQVQGDMYYTGQLNQRGPARAVFELYRGFELEWINSGTTYWFPNFPNADVNALGQEIVREVAIPGGGYTVLRDHQPFMFATEPGLYFFIVSGMADDSYLFIDAHVTGDARFLGSVVGGPESIFALRTHDFQGTLAAQAGDLDVAMNASAAVSVNRMLHGEFECGTEVWECSVQDPSGNVRRLGDDTPRWIFFEDPLPGEWTFTLEKNVDADFERFVLFAIDLKFPKKAERQRH